MRDPDWDDIYLSGPNRNCFRANCEVELAVNNQ
jgi:hypothetical protein